MERALETTLDAFILDVDGVLTDGGYYYSADGKVLKKFGPDDNDALKLLARYIDIHAVSGDHRGFPITHKRVAEDMGLKLDLVSTDCRVQWLAERYNPARLIYMGDGIFDALVFRAVGYGIAPANADPVALRTADFVTSRSGGDRAVSEAVMHVLERFFGVCDIFDILEGRKNARG
ncbi:MAG: phosphatase [Alphaproteobacteria bacterium]|nr:phosphatase [Alphaproteobacteria bacterium]